MYFRPYTHRCFLLQLVAGGQVSTLLFTSIFADLKTFSKVRQVCCVTRKLPAK